MTPKVPGPDSLVLLRLGLFLVEGVSALISLVTEKLSDLESTPLSDD
jgi:hypothetical protein